MGRVNSPYERRITRTQGYRDNAWKEEKSKAVFKSFTEHYQLDFPEITDKTTQIELGDYRNGTDRYIECKSQSIGAYAQNFIEIGEYNTGRDIHDGKHSLTSEWLRSHGVDLYDCNIRERFNTKATQKFGNPSTYNPGITPLLRGADIFYINRDTELIYFYKAETLKALILEEIRQDRLFWGGGRSNETTIAVFVKNSEARWQKVKGEWRFIGNDPAIEQAVWDYLKE